MTNTPGHVRKLPSGRWQAIVTHGVRADGKPNRRSKTFADESGARRWCVIAAHEMGAQTDGVEGVTLRDLWKSFKHVRGPHLANKTMYNYKRMMEGTWLPMMGDEEVVRLDMGRVQDALLAMTRENAKHHRRILSTVLTHGKDIGVATENPMAGRRFRMPERTSVDDKVDDDPFAAIEGARDVWGPSEVMECLDKIRGLPLEPAWLMCVGAGLRVEESLAVRKADVRRTEVMGREVTQIAVHAARTELDGVKRTKTARSVRIAAMMEPFGMRLWEIANELEDKADLLCPVSASNQNRMWRSYFEKPPKYHKRMSEKRKTTGRLRGLQYVPLSRMRATHATLMQEAGVPDSLNALVHGHSERVSYANYQRGRSEMAASRTESAMGW